MADLQGNHSYKQLLEQLPAADFVVCTHNILLDPKLSALKVLPHSFLVFEEGHNVEQQACEAYSMHLSYAQLLQIKLALQLLLQGNSDDTARQKLSCIDSSRLNYFCQNSSFYPSVIQQSFNDIPDISQLQFLHMLLRCAHFVGEIFQGKAAPEVLIGTQVVSDLLEKVSADVRVLGFSVQYLH